MKLHPPSSLRSVIARLIRLRFDPMGALRAWLWPSDRLGGVVCEMI